MDGQELIIKCRRSEKEFDELQTVWTQLLADSASNSIFLCWDWVRLWWSIYGEPHELYLVEARTREGLLVGLAPLKIAKRKFGGRVAEFLGQGGGVTPEYLDFIVRNSWEPIALPAILRYIASDSAVTGFDLRTIPSDSPNLSIIRRTLRESGTVREAEESQCPVIELPNTWEEFLKSKSRNYRKKIKEYEKRCNRDLRITFRRSRNANELHSDLESLKRLHKARWGNKSRAFSNDSYVKFHAEFASLLLQRDALRLYVIADEDRAISVLYCFRDSNTIYYYQSGRDPTYSRYRLGLVAIHWAIRESITEGLKYFDLLTGTEQYKKRWATDCACNIRIECHSRGIFDKCVMAIRAFWNELFRGSKKE